MKSFRISRSCSTAALMVASALPSLARQGDTEADTALGIVAARTGIAAERLSLLESGRASYPQSGRSTRTFKVIDDAGQSYGVALDERGREVRTEVLVHQEEQARLARFGKVDETLFRILEATEPQTRLPVAIWVVERESGGVQRPLPEEMSYLFPTEAKLGQFLDTVASERADAVQTSIAPVLPRLDAEEIRYELNPTAPVVYASLTPEQIRRVGAWDEVDQIYSAPDVEPALDIARRTINAHVVEAMGINGFGVRAAQIEVGGRVQLANPNLYGIVQDPLFVCAAPSGHSTYVAGILRSTHALVRGIAPAMNLWAGGSCGGVEAQLTDRSTAASTWGARALNCSFGRDDALAVGSMDRFYDNMVMNLARTVVIAAGNEGNTTGNTLSPATAYNVITVGSFDDKNTVPWLGDTMSTFTSYKDPLSTHGDREKPEISAPGTGIISTTVAAPWVGAFGSTNGTSYACPMVAGTAVQMMQRDAVLQSWPESVKAILMATATHDIEPPTRLSEKEGAGSLVSNLADQIVRRVGGNWGGTGYTCASPVDFDATTMNLTAGKRVRVVITWDNDPAYANYATQPCADLDLYVVNPTGGLVATSSSWDNTFEIVDFVAPVTGAYKLRVHKFRCDLSPRYLGYAWYQLP